MKAYKAPLKLNNFLLLNHHYSFIHPEEGKEINIVETVSQYILDIDFTFREIGKDEYQLFTKIGVNDPKKPLPGYILFVEGVCFFSFDDSKELTPQDKSNLLHISGLNICINSLRNILASTTAHGPFGKYTLPAIDVGQLLKDKQAKSEKKEEI